MTNKEKAKVLDTLLEILNIDVGVIKMEQYSLIITDDEKEESIPITKSQAKILLKFFDKRNGK